MPSHEKENPLVLTPFAPGRRVGLSRSYRSSLVTVKATSNRVNMPAPTTKVAPEASKTMKQEDPEEDIYGPPEDSGDEPDQATIKATVFKRSSQEPTTKISNGRPAKNGKTPGAATVNGSTAGTRKSTREILSTQDSLSSSSPKRKSQEDPPASSASYDVFGDIKRKKVKRGYGSSSQPKSSANNGKKGLKDSGLKKPEDGSTSPQTPEKKSRSFEGLFSPGSSPESGRKILIKPVFSPVKEEDSPMKQLKLPMSFGDELSPPPATRKPRGTKEEPEEPLTQLARFNTYGGLDDEFASTAKELLGTDRPVLPTTTHDDLDDFFATHTQRSVCPMCNAPVDPSDLRAFGTMNTRKQQKFCQSHRKKTALEEWETKAYPDINWDKLEARISKHYSFIRKVINGGASHYRDLLEDRVNAGQDRNLMKMTTNLTPGYYGARGLRIISENLMLEFTSLIKKKAVSDRRISSRGPTAFVQSVLVPEVAVRLIMDDMKVKTERARDILDESAGVGELIHEEIKDVVRRHVEDSEEEADFDD